MLFLHTCTHFSHLITLPHTSVSLTSCIYIVFSVLNILTHMATMLRVVSLLVSDSPPVF